MVNSRYSKLLPTYEAEPLETSRGGYTITMRECSGAEDVLKTLAEEKLASPELERLHVGWGSFRNLDIAAARESAAVVLLDVNDNQFKVWGAVKKALVTAASAPEFIDVLVPLLPKDPPLRQFTEDIRDWLASDLPRPGSWLCEAAPARFSHIRNLFNNGRVLTYCLDIRGGLNPHLDIFLRLRTTLVNGCKIYGLSTDTLYVTNLPWMMQQARGFFGEAHAAWSSDGDSGGSAALRRNLEAIAPLFTHLISASRLAPCSRPDDLRWQTECLSPGAWLQSYT